MLLGTTQEKEDSIGTVGPEESLQTTISFKKIYSFIFAQFKSFYENVHANVLYCLFLYSPPALSFSYFALYHYYLCVQQSQLLYTTPQFDLSEFLYCGALTFCVTFL